jgi:hypothetical protein
VATVNHMLTCTVLAVFCTYLAARLEFEAAMLRHFRKVNLPYHFLDYASSFCFMGEELTPW